VIVVADAIPDLDLGNFADRYDTVWAGRSERRAWRIVLEVRRGGVRFARIFRVGQAEVDHRRIGAGKGYAILGEPGVLELAPHIELFLHAGLAFLLRAETGCRGPTVGGGGLRAGPQGPRQQQAQDAGFLHDLRRLLRVGRNHERIIQQILEMPQRNFGLVQARQRVDMERPRLLIDRRDLTYLSAIGNRRWFS
jgi:hypothetical protein